jgi:hydrogenase expression/formation protein HypE
MAILSVRNDLRFDAPIQSDCAPLGSLIGGLLGGVQGVRWMRDPTRGGVATTLNELVRGRGFGLVLDGPAIPVRPPVRALAEILGLDPLYVACEGRVLAVVDGASVDGALECLRGHPHGRDAAVIGRVVDAPAGRVLLKTSIGGMRLLDMLTGEQLPRIC